MTLVAKSGDQATDQCLGYRTVDPSRTVQITKGTEPLERETTKRLSAQS